MCSSQLFHKYRYQVCAHFSVSIYKLLELVVFAKNISRASNIMDYQLPKRKRGTRLLPRSVLMGKFEQAKYWRHVILVN